MKATLMSMAIALALAFAFSMAVGQGSMEKMDNSVMKAPDFTASDCCGKQYSLADFRGKVIVLEWMNPGCPFVQRHYREGTFKKLDEEYADRGVVWLAVNSTSTCSAEETHKWVEKYSLPYPILVDQDGKLGKLYHAKTTPDLVVIGRNGELVYEGAIDDDPNGEKEHRTVYVKQAIDAALVGSLPAVRETKSYGCGVKYAR